MNDERMKPKLMLIGLGGLGGAMLELLAREPCLGQIVVGGRNEEQGAARSNLTRLGTVAQGFAPDVRFLRIDLDEAARVAEIVSREAPDLILSTATRQTWWLPDLPALRAGGLRRVRFGMWLPIHLTLTLKLMQALHEADYRGMVLTAPFPDVVNCILGRLGLPPTCGVGNLDEIVPKVRLLAAQRLGVRCGEIEVLLVAHHALERYVFRAAPKPQPSSCEVPPYFLRVCLHGEDVTKTVAAHELLMAPYPLPWGPAWSFLTAASTARLVRALSSDHETLLHAPGPHGLPGGYPVVVRRGSVECAPIDGLTAAEAVSINERSHRFDGIKRIEPDGTVVFCQEDAELMRQVLGYDCDRLPPTEAEPRARELMERFREYAARLGVQLSGITGVRTEN
jgi:hypothetical protein